MFTFGDIFEQENHEKFLREAFQNGEYLGPDSTVKAYKLFKKNHKTGTIHPLFINKKVAVPKDAEVEAENHPTKGFSPRFGWHAGVEPSAPHLYNMEKPMKSQKDRVWHEVEMRDVTRHQRPATQGGGWYTSKFLKVGREMSHDEVAAHLAKKK